MSIYKELPDFNKQDSNQYSTELISISFIDQHILSLKSAYNENNLSKLKQFSTRIIHDFHSDRGIIDHILQTDLLDFLANCLNDEFSDKMYIILDLLQYLLSSKNENVTVCLINNNGISALNSFLSPQYDHVVLDQVLYCIGYALFDIIKCQNLGILPPIEFIHIEKETFEQILTADPQLLEPVLNLLYNCLLVLTDYDLTIRTLLFYIFLIDVDRCSTKSLARFFKLFVGKIKRAHEIHHPNNFPFEIFQESQLSAIFIHIFLHERFQLETHTTENDVVYWATKLMILFMKNDTEDEIFLNKVRLILPEDYVKMIFNTNSTDNSMETIFHLLVLICSEHPDFAYIIASYQDPKTGGNKLLNYQYNLDIFSFNVKVWYLRFLSILVNVGHPDCFNVFFTGEFVATILQLFDPESISLSKSCLLIINSIVQKINREGHFPMLDVFHELQFEELMDKFLEEATEKVLQDLGHQLIQEFSKAEYAANQT